MQAERLTRIEVTEQSRDSLFKLVSGDNDINEPMLKEELR